MKIPVIVLRNLVVLPKMFIHFDLEREPSKQAAEYAAKNQGRIFMVIQEMEGEEYPQSEYGISKYGTIGTIKQLIKLPGGIIRVLAEGGERGFIHSMYKTEDHMEGEVERLGVYPFDGGESRAEGYLRALKEAAAEYAKVNPQAETTVKQLLAVSDLKVFAEIASTRLPLGVSYAKEYLKQDSVSGQAVSLLSFLAKETETVKYRNEIQEQVKQRLDKNQKEYVMREQMRAIRSELGEDEQSEAEVFLKQTDELEASDEIKEKIKKEIGRFSSIPSGTQEGTVSRNYIETLLELPWEKKSEDSDDIVSARAILERDHYGMEKIKERILEFLAVRHFTGEAGGSILCLVGPPGTGKTSIAKSVASALNKKYVRISLGGVHDEAEIRGHRRTYVGALPGRIATALKQAGVCNPLMLLDEIDKTGSDYKGDISSALLEVLDGEQNVRFSDHYVEIPIDLSHVLFIATANTVETIPRPLLDRMEIIEVTGYTENEKFHIAKDYLVPKQLVKNGMTAERVSFEEEALKKLIHGYTRESGVRNLERRIGQIIRKAAMEILEKDRAFVTITEEKVLEYLGKEIIRTNPANEENQIGIVRGLAWTSVGGDTLEIEVNVMPGDGQLQLTGQLGDVMQESAKAGFTYIRSIAEKYGVKDSFFKENDIHLHIPEGAVPKDGPSAGITMAVAMLSAVTGKKVLSDLAMTGEITLRGRILPIGGLKEKLLAAKIAGIHKVIVPGKNRPDVDELSPEITEGITICFADSMEDVLCLCFEEKK